MLRSRGRLWNLSFGEILTQPLTLEVEIVSPNFRASVRVDLSNDQKTFENENQLSAYHTMSNKQRLGYNPFAAAETGIVDVFYPDHPNNVSGRFNEDAKEFLYREFSYFLSFVQRRRVLISGIFLKPSTGLLSLGIHSAAEMMDAVALGTPAIAPSRLQAALDCYVNWRASVTSSDGQELHGVTVRMNNLLNLPYAYERAEGYWRILEALGADLPDCTSSDALYARAKKVAGVKSESKNLKRVCRTADFVGSQEADKLASAFAFRNEISHEFVGFDMLGNTDAGKAMNFLQRLCELFVAKRIAFDAAELATPSNGLNFGRVM